MVTDEVAQQIEAALARYEDLRGRAKYDDLSDHPDDELVEVRTLCAAAIARLAPPHSHYVDAAREALEKHPGAAIVDMAGILRALQANYEAGHLQTVAELIHAEVFGDFLEMATHLLEAGYKDAAAVIGGVVLEEHLRKLVGKTGGPVHKQGGRPKKAESLNADLAKSGVYSTLEQKAVTAWLGIRNEAAHGRFDQYDAGQVASLLRDIRDFLIRHPA